MPITITPYLFKHATSAGSHRASVFETVERDGRTVALRIGTLNVPRPRNPFRKEFDTARLPHMLIDAMSSSDGVRASVEDLSDFDRDNLIMTARAILAEGGIHDDVVLADPPGMTFQRKPVHDIAAFQGFADGVRVMIAVSDENSLIHATALVNVTGNDGSLHALRVKLQSSTAPGKSGKKIADLNPRADLARQGLDIETRNYLNQGFRPASRSDIPNAFANKLIADVEAELEIGRAHV